MTHRPPARRRPWVAGLLSFPLLALAVFAGAAPAAAAPIGFVVDSLATTGDGTVGDGVCATAAGECTLTAALEEANAVDPTSGVDAVDITFSVTGAIDVVNDADAMFVGTLGESGGIAGLGAQFLVDSAVPVSIDFDGIESVEHTFDSVYSMFYIASDDVTVSNLDNVLGGRAAFSIDSSDVTLSDVEIKDPDTAIDFIGIALLDGASNVTLNDLVIASQSFVGIMVDNNATVTGVEINRLSSSGHASAHIDFEDGSVVDGFVVNDSTIGTAGEISPSPLLYLNPNQDTTGFELNDSTFASPNQFGIGIYGGNVTLSDTVISGSVFTGTNTVFQDGGAAEVTGLTIIDNTFTDTLGRVLNFQATDLDGATITGNQFLDARGNAAATIYVGQTSDDSLIASNVFEQSAGADANRWAIYHAPADAVAGEDTGWTFRANAIDGYVGTSNGPIFSTPRGTTLIEQNTFGPETSGSREEETETSLLYFVANNGAANDRIQTYRPTSAVFTGTDLTLRVAPVSPPLATNNAPIGPVTVDVYWTADDNAEAYVGRLADVSGATTATLPWTGGPGFVRVQTIDAAGQSSQYSAVVQAPLDNTAPAAPAVDRTPLTGALTGTGEPGATINVVAPNGDIVCTTTVGTDGTWSCVPPVALTCATTYQVTQTDLAGNVSSPTSFTTAACGAGGNGGAAGSGGAAGGLLPSTGAGVGLLALLAGLLAIGTGLGLSSFRRLSAV